MNDPVSNDIPAYPVIDKITTEQTVQTNMETQAPDQVVINTNRDNPFIIDTQRDKVESQQPQQVIIVHQTNVKHVHVTPAYPSLNRGLAVLIFLLNIFFPGVGTMIAGCSSPEHSGLICTGILQLVLTCIIIGWFWSIFTGIMILAKSK
jgi:hypothetical protein